MENNLNNKDIDILLNEFFSKDDLKSLSADVMGRLLMKLVRLSAIVKLFWPGKRIM